MSKEAPWISLAIDWQDSAMLDDSTHGERLAWISLLCFAKAQGRAGRVRLRDRTFSQAYRLSVESVEGMLRRAKQAGAVTIEGDLVTVVNWSAYQDPKGRVQSHKKHRENSDCEDFNKTPPTSTKDQGPSTKHHGPEAPPSPPLPDDVDSAALRDAFAAWIAYKTERREQYRPQGLRSAVTHLANMVRQHSETTVIKAIHRAMANNWVGWDQESSFGVSRNGPPKPKQYQRRPTR